MSEFSDLYRKVVNLDYDEIVKVASKALPDLLNYLEEQGIDADGQVAFYHALFKLFVSADKNCSRDEYRLYLDILGLDESDCSANQFFEMTNHGSDNKFINDIDEVIDSFPREAKNACCFIGLAILAVDGTITTEEQKLFERIFG